MKTTWLLLPDGREEFADAVEALNRKLLQRRIDLNQPGDMQPFTRATLAFGFPIAWASRSEDVDPTAVVRLVYAAGWSHPAQLLYRSEDEDRWNYVRIMPRPATLDSSPGMGSESWDDVRTRVRSRTRSSTRSSSADGGSSTGPTSPDSSA